MISPNQNQIFESSSETLESFHSNETKERKSSKVQVSRRSLRHLRIEKNLTQKEISKLLKLTRSQYQRLENKSADKLTVGEIHMIAKGLSITSEEVIKKLSSQQNSKVKCGAFNKPALLMNLCDGVKITSFCDEPKEYFVGTMEIMPKKTLSKHDSPHAQKIYYSVSRGEVLFVIDRQKEIFLKKNDYIILENIAEYEMYNPHPVYPAELMVTASSSLLIK